ncbi:hypothetical protein CK203_076873 [Vitis vinifera]|uniref:Reverse transcriptase domain-containing protein n=1 Tax=Vitis vinifera TaxID=29760 RepID=A0A438ET68_VITVI|nr:hypothetical protein CK203_076873 [Vitis vinifera]
MTASTINLSNNTLIEASTTINIKLTHEKNNEKKKKKKIEASTTINIKQTHVLEFMQSGEEGVVFKIDFEKAYGHVKWDFVDHVLEKKGFSSKWRSWMRDCLSSVSYAILVNGNAKGWVKASIGLRQGDPLSPFLFTIVADVLSRMLLKAEERKLQTLKSLLLVFGQISGLKVNLDKSNLFGINLDQNHLSRFWDLVIERISKRLAGWQKAFLSFGGVGEGKRDHLVSWDAVCKPRVKGGLGFGKILLRNRALLRKWLWRFPRKSTALWHQDFSKYTRWVDQIFKIQYPRLFRVVMDKNILISSILSSDRPFTWNFNFCPSDARSWSLSSSGLFTVKSFFIALSQMPRLSPLFPTKFVWNSQVPFKVKAFVWLMAHKKQGESADHIFLHCSVSLGLWHRLFQLAKMDWVPPRSISDMMSINYKGLAIPREGGFVIECVHSFNLGYVAGKKCQDI